MTTLKFLLIFIITGFCSCGQKPVKHTVDPAAVELNNKIIPLVSSLDNMDSCRKALVFLDSATSIDSNYFLGYYNKLMFLSSLKEYHKAVLVINNCIRIAPDAHDLYLTGGMLYEKVGDNVSSKMYFEKSLSICNSVLDTMMTNNNNYVMLSTNKAINLIMLGDSIMANKTLKKLYEAQPDNPEFDNVEKKYIQSLMNKNKIQLMEIISNPEKDSR